MPDKTDEKQGKFIKGKSGNPLSGPKGKKNKATILAEKLFEDDIEKICKQLIKQRKGIFMLSSGGELRNLRKNLFKIARILIFSQPLC